MNDQITQAYTALFANAQTPQEQAEVRRRYSQALMGDQARTPMREDREFDAGAQQRQEEARRFDVGIDSRNRLLQMLMAGGGAMGGAPGGGGRSSPYAAIPQSSAWGGGGGYDYGEPPRPGIGAVGGMGPGMPMGRGPMQRPGMAVDPMRKQTENFLAELLRR